MSQPNDQPALLMAGIPEINAYFYHRLRFSVGDPAALIELPRDREGPRAILIVRDIEMQRARQHARADQVACPADFTPAEGLSGDRETATAQAVAECLRRHGIQRVIGDRTLPLIFSDLLRQAGIDVQCDSERGVLERRAKDAQEIDFLREAQQATEGAMEMACRLVAAATVRQDGVLLWEGQPLTSERVRAAIDHWLLDRGYVSPPSIIAGGPLASDCHDIGTGALRTGEPVIIDIFPQNRITRYWGDCTRTVVHGKIPEEVHRMHSAVVDAKDAAAAVVRAGVTGEDVHRATQAVIVDHGYAMGLPSANDPDSYCAMTHGTGHGVGLNVHEPPLLDRNGPCLVVGDALTIEPGLYRRDLGGVRVEDMVIVRADGCDNLNSLYEGLEWR
jgi:Xaa-Pro aminopeptidase